MNVGIRLPRPPVERPSAWIGAELPKRPEEWSFRLSSAALVEIEAAMIAIIARRLDVAAIMPPDWKVLATPLPVLAHASGRAA